jgi:hypothetical protein
LHLEEREKKVQVVLHQDRRNTRRGQTKRKETKEKTWTTKKKHTHKACTCEKRNTRGSSKREETQKAITSQFIHCSQLQEDIKPEKIKVRRARDYSQEH